MLEKTEGTFFFIVQLSESVTVTKTILMFNYDNTYIYIHI